MITLPKFTYTSILINILAICGLIYLAVSIPPSVISVPFFILFAGTSYTFTVTNIVFLFALQRLEIRKDQDINATKTPNEIYKTIFKKHLKYGILLMIILLVKIIYSWNS